MRKLTTLAAAAALLSTAMLASAPSQAMTFGAPSGVRGAAETLTVIDQTACWRRGWHGILRWPALRFARVTPRRLTAI